MSILQKVTGFRNNIKSRPIEHCRPLPTPGFGKDIVGTAPDKMDRLSPLTEQIEMQSLRRAIATGVIIERNGKWKSPQSVIRFVRKPIERSKVGIVNIFPNGAGKVRLTTLDERRNRRVPRN